MKYRIMTVNDDEDEQSLDLDDSPVDSPHITDVELVDDWTVRVCLRVSENGADIATYVYLRTQYPVGRIVKVLYESPS